MDNKENIDIIGTLSEATTNAKIKTKNFITAQFSNIVSIALIIVAYLMFFTEGSLTTFADIKKLSIIIVVLLFVNNAVFNNMIESGSAKARQSTLYKTAVEAYNKTMERAKATASGLERLAEYCEIYNSKILENDRKERLNSLGIKYETYITSYISKKTSQLKAIKASAGNQVLTKAQIRAILACNRMKSPALKSERILRSGQFGGNGRKILGSSPQQKLHFVRVRKILTSTLISIMSAAIVLDMMKDFSFAKFVEATVKVAPIFLSAFLGYKTGYNNIYIDTVNYMTAQTTILDNYIKWLETAPQV